MPPRNAALKVQGAVNQTRWTLSQDNTPVNTPKPKAKDSFIMQANGAYLDHQRDHQQPLPRYSDYDGSHSHYSVASGRESGMMGWEPELPKPLNGGEFDAFDFHQTPMNEETHLNLNLNTHMPAHNTDVVGRHLLYETALLDTQTFEILEIGEVDALKKEQTRLNAKIEASQRKLALESKVRDAAQNLQRLYSTNKRPDTPQSPESPKKHRNSLLPGGRPRGGSNSSPETSLKAEGELAASVKKVDELHEQITALLDRRQDVERKLLRHTAAVLAEEANRVVESAVPGVVNGHHFDDEDDFGSYGFNEYDGIRDILHGKPAGASKQTQQYEDQFARMQDRLEQLNYQLRNVISEAGQTLGKAPAAELGLDQSDDSYVRVENRFNRLEQNLQTLSQQHHDIRTIEEQNMHSLEQLERHSRAMEEQLEGVNGQLYSALLQASDNEPVPGLQEPPRSSGHGYEMQLQYMEEGLMTMEQLLQQRSQSGELLDAQAKAEDLAKKHGEYESTVGGLWDILQSDSSSPRGGEDNGQEESPVSPLVESFSLAAFSSRVQQIFNRAQAAQSQQDILRRQIQQQRDLGGKSDMEKDRQIAEIQGRHDELAETHGALQQDLADLMVKHEQSEGNANQSHSELMRVMDEVEEMKKTIDAKQQQRDEMAGQVSGFRKHIEELEAQITQMTEDNDAVEGKHGEMHQNMEKLESEVVRLTTELTMAKADLDGAYGTRAERAGAQAAEVESLTEKNKEIHSELESLRSEVGDLRSNPKAAQLERELQDMTNEFQEMTKESIALEREREQLDALIDSLRDRCDALEAQVSDERMQRAGMSRVDEKEAHSMLVLKQEFKKMMREQRSEGVRLLRAEQEERRKLESELRKIRQANGPLAKNLSNESGTSTPASAAL